MPLFLVAWIRFVDRTGWRTMLAAAAAYLLAAIGAAYYAVLTTVLTAVYVLAEAAKAARRRDLRWVRNQLEWLVAFGALAGFGSLLIFGNTAWAMANGFAGTRTMA